MESVAEKKDLPHLFVKENESNIPYYTLLTIAGLAAFLAMVTDVIKQMGKIPYAMVGLIVTTGSIFIFRPYLLKKIK